jgi:hypothetical protein
MSLLYRLFFTWALPSSKYQIDLANFLKIHLSNNTFHKRSGLTWREVGLAPVVAFRVPHPVTTAILKQNKNNYYN